MPEAPSARRYCPKKRSARRPPFPPKSLAPLPPAPAGKGWEEILVENWLVWLGGVALALGGAFLVKLSIDYGLLTPAVRVALGVLLGLALWAGAEWIVWGEPAEARPSNVSQALAAAGAATIFASLYAAYQLYGLLPPALAFPLLALTAAATVLMSLQHGPFVAVLGLAGAFAVPAMVSSEQPSAPALFAYLILVGAGSLALLRHRAWWWLAWIALAGSIGWALLWLAMLYDPADVWVVGGYLLAQIGLFAALRRGIPGVPFLEGVIDEPAVRAVVRTAFWAISAAVLVLVQVDSDGTAALGCAFLTAFSLLAFAYRDSRLDDVLAAAGALAAALLALWSLPLPVDQRIGLLHNLPPEEVGRFLTVAIAFGLLLGAGGFASLARVPRPSRWAALSAATPPILLAVSYWRIAAFGLDLDWTVVALALAALELAAACWAAQRRDGEAENELVLAAYAVGVLGCTILAAVFVLENAWLTVALALHLPALAWVEGRLRLPVLRHVALGIAAAVLVRLTLNPEVLRYALSDTLIFNWLLYGYGVPAAAFILATRQFGSRADDLLVKVLEAGSVVFSVLLVTLELWHALSDRPLRFVLDDFALNAVETIAWLCNGRVAAAPRRAARPGRIALERRHPVRDRDRLRGRLAGDLSQSGDAFFWRAGRRLVPPRLAVPGLCDPGGALCRDRLLSAGSTRPLAGGAGSRRRLRLSLGDTRSAPFLPRRPLEPRLDRRSGMVRLLGRLARLRRGRARGGAQMAQPLAAPRLVARPRPGRRQSVSVRHGRSQRRRCGRFPSSVSARFWSASATPIGGCSHCSPIPSRPRKK